MASVCSVIVSDTVLVVTVCLCSDTSLILVTSLTSGKITANVQYSYHAFICDQALAEAKFGAKSI